MSELTDKLKRAAFEVARYNHVKESKVIMEAVRLLEAYEEALTPSGETKAIHIGEYQEVCFYGQDRKAYVPVTWTTVKDIMKKIRDSVLTFQKK